MTETEWRNILTKSRAHNDFCSFENSILYDMCKKQPLHTQEDICSAKVRIIGRVYSAAIERGAELGSSVYTEIVPKTMKKYGSKIDKQLKNLSSENLDNIFTVYNTVFECFNKISGKKNISLTSKYLHFHNPDAFYIYDSRAKKAISILMNQLNIEYSIIKESKNDFNTKYDNISDYINFFLKCKACCKTIEEKFHEKLTPRQLDDILLTMTVD